MTFELTLRYSFFVMKLLQWTAVPVQPVSSSQNDHGVTNDSHFLNILSELGYLVPSTHVGMLRNDKEAIITAVKLFQKYVKIPVTGKLDAITKKFISKPRCGVADVVGARRRQRRYNHQGSTWKDLKLTWALENDNNDGLSQYAVRRLITRAFHKWSSVTNLHFVELVGRPKNSAQIRIRFVQRAHGDPYPFDGQGGLLAHAFYPMNNLGIAGDIHFDDDEEFIIRGKSVGDQKKLLWIAVHEIGHSIGLEHSDEQGAIMFPYYQEIEADDFKLTYDDVLGIQLLYGGKRKGITVAPSPSTSITPPPSPRCVDTMDAAFVGMNGKLYFTSRNQLFSSHSGKGGGMDGPFRISSYFHGINRVDAVFTHAYYKSHTVFHGDTFSVYEETRVRHGGSRKINHGFQGMKERLANVDAAFVWPGSRALYVFKGERYWRMKPIGGTRDYRVETGYPQIIAKKWKGLPSTIDAAFVWINGKLYFTKGNLYYRWDDRSQAVHSGYPIKLSRSFLKCRWN